VSGVQIPAPPPVKCSTNIDLFVFRIIFYQVAMGLQFFDRKQLGILGDSLDIAEDATCNYYKLSLSQWKRHRFDIKTLSGLFGEDIKDNVFALLKRYEKDDKAEADSFYKRRDFYIICMQDHQILRALRRDKDLKLLPLLSYVLTHELVHIVRFCNFHVSFDTREEHNRLREEKIVHQKTYEILQKLSLPNMDYILGSYMPNRLANNLDISYV
jgi:hypothetical protein